jgi:hypothetical protein
MWSETPSTQLVVWDGAAAPTTTTTTGHHSDDNHDGTACWAIPPESCLNDNSTTCGDVPTTTKKEDLPVATITNKVDDVHDDDGCEDGCCCEAVCCCVASIGCVVKGLCQVLRCVLCVDIYHDGGCCCC